MRCDVTSEKDVAALVTPAGRVRRLDVMVNNAGMTRDTTMRKMTLDDFDRHRHPHRAPGSAPAPRRVMREQGGGSIMNMSSISGKVGNPGQTNYSAAKAGIVGLTKAAAKEVGFAGFGSTRSSPG